MVKVTVKEKRKFNFLVVGLLVVIVALMAWQYLL
jgi:hypothetical protein